MEGAAAIGIILLIFGLILVGVELYVPGFGLPGISGILCLVGGVLLTADTIEEGLTIAVIIVVILAVMFTLAAVLFKRGKAPIILNSEMTARAGYLNRSDLEYLIGKEGIASTDLKPAGKCNIDGVEFDVRSEQQYTRRGTRIQISRIHENTIMVKEL